MKNGSTENERRLEFGVACAQNAARADSTVEP